MFLVRTQRYHRVDRVDRTLQERSRVLFLVTVVIVSSLIGFSPHLCY
jgi:hypothetical protein